MRGLAGLGVIVTGAGRGIGLATARRFGEEGARLFLCDRDGSTLDGAVRSLPPELVAGSSVCDVARSEDVARMVSSAKRDLETIDVLVNNAGIATLAGVLEVSLEEWDETLRVNLKGAFIVSQAVAKEMVAAGRGGSIINMSSTNGLVAEVGYAPYNASKAGLLLLSQTLAIELASFGIRVNSVCPGYIVTPLSATLDSKSFVESYIRDHIPLGHTGTPEDVAGMCAFLASSDSAFVTGAAFVVDGGQLAHSGNR
jgi:NAD(P)-dependent dehydrogenase (short-subunit alcohol dehydrogenase family)